MKMFVFLTLLCGLSLCDAEGSLKSRMERFCEDDSHYKNADLIEDWEGEAAAYLVGPQTCSKHRLRIIRNTNTTITYIVANSLATFDEFNYVRIGNHYETSDDIEGQRSKQYFFPVLDSDGETEQELLLIMDCVNYLRGPSWRVLTREYDGACDTDCRKSLNAIGFRIDLEMCQRRDREIR